MNDNLAIYNKVRSVPDEAKKEIKGGRLSGKTDISPIWRIKILTETFGICGFGWKYEITKQWTEIGANSEVSAFVNIDLFVKMDNEWSAAIPGTGGSSFIAKEKNGLYTSDECFKMALTDAISVSCKALGIAADVYWEADKSKYDKPNINTDKSTNKNMNTDKENDKKDEEKKETNDKTLRLRIGKMLIEMEGDKDKALLKLTEITTFEVNGKLIKGVDSLDRLKENRLKTTYGKIKQLYELWKKNNEEKGFDV